MLTAVIPAAGASKRMMFPKGALRIGGVSLLRLQCDALFQSVTRVVVVLGWGAGLVGRDLPQGVERVVAPRWWRGTQIDSVRFALAEYEGPALVHPVDVPPVAPAVVGRLRGAGGSAVPLYAGRRGHPILLSATAVRRLGAEALAGGLRSLLVTAAEVPVEDPSVLENLNDPRALAAWLRRRQAMRDGGRGTR
jgi:CTP:molybdopterin cytidylyltransferase MocA